MEETPTPPEPQPPTPEEVLAGDPAHQLISRFFHEHLAKLEKGTVLELGSRARSGNERTELIPNHLDYVGFDIVDGPNVNIVGDAHQLSKYFKKKSIDCIFSMSVFEHLAMPWKVAIEMNKVLRLGGLCMHTTHQAWPIHEMPWDYWRYSDDTWKAIFNSKTGFEVMEAQLGEPANLHPVNVHPAVKDVHIYPTFMMSAVVARKVSRTWLRWNVPLSEITDTKYPN